MASTDPSPSLAPMPALLDPRPPLLDPEPAVTAPPASSFGLRRAAAFWLGFVALVAFAFYLFSGVLLPFVAGIVLAYLLDPFVDRLERFGAGRTVASLVVLVVILGAFVLLLILVAPLLASQLAALVRSLPGYLSSIQASVVGTAGPLLERLGLEGAAGDLKSSVGDLAGQGVAYAGTFMAGLWSRGTAIVDLLSLIVVTPVVTFYLIQDWDRMIAGVDRWLPRDHRDTIHAIFRDIDRALAGFIRGQSLLCLFLGVWYSAGLLIVGLNFGVLIGISAGVLSFIPYVGSVLGLGIALIVAFTQFGTDWPHIVGVLVAFGTGQFLEGNILSPKLVGDSVGLHPVWVMFALLAFGSLLGFVGLLLAVPMAAIVGVLLRFALSRYLRSPLYAGSSSLLGARAERE